MSLAFGHVRQSLRSQTLRCIPDGGRLHDAAAHALKQSLRPRLLVWVALLMKAIQHSFMTAQSLLVTGHCYSTSPPFLASG